MKRVTIALLSFMVASVALADDSSQKSVMIINNSAFDMTIHYGFSYPTPTAFVSTKSYEATLPNINLNNNSTFITLPENTDGKHYYLQVFDASDNNPKQDQSMGTKPLQPPCRLDSLGKANAIILNDHDGHISCKPIKINSKN